MTFIVFRGSITNSPTMSARRSNLPAIEPRLVLPATVARPSIPDSGPSQFTPHTLESLTAAQKQVSTTVIPRTKSNCRNIAAELALVHGDRANIGAILSASWLKRPDRRSPKQTVASLKVVCSTAEAANCLLQERIFVAGHLVVIRKDLKEPIRCNKCQRYGHIRASCKSPERCATCASPDHVTTECPPNPTPRCPIFKKQCDDLESCLPENHMPYFPTGEAWTWAAAPPKLSKETPVHRPRVDHAPPAPTQIPKAPPRPVRQGTLDQFVVPSRPGSQLDHRRDTAAPTPSQ
ncbi:hypothetical protein D9615_002619 [Tricholomella constricta]|uniref:CCHC-type domain-containing protein n=1 Tax=Tricholomella constricta TaxID=117010 RepID=A0A8H5HMS4_9AGAR|nr:hypothetical protein D9615_002619 [Tricholomella constricta]